MEGMDHSEATSLVESAGVIGSEEIKAYRRIERVTGIQLRTSDAATTQPHVYRHFSDIHGDRSICESTHKADDPFIFYGYQRRPGVLSGE